MNETIFKDNRGQVIFVGDTVQYRLGKFAKKSGGPTLHLVTYSKKGIGLMNIQHPEYGSRLLRQSDCEYITIFDKSHRLLA